MSKENAIRYHQRVMNDYIQARYIHKSEALNEAADVLFSRNNLLNYGYALPPFVREIEAYIQKAVEIERTAQDQQPGAPNEGEQGYGEPATLSDRAWRRMMREGHAGAQTGVGKRHSRKMRDVVGRDLDTDDPNPKARRRALERIYRWRGNHSENRQHTEFQPHKAHHLAKLGFFGRPGATPNLHGHTPLAFNLIQETYHRSPGKLDEMMIEAEKHMPPAATSDLMLGKWSGDGVTHEKLRKQALRRFREAHREKFPQSRQPDINDFFHHKMYELRGVPSDQLFDSDLYDQDTGQMTYANIDDMVKQNRHREMGFLPVMLGITMLDYEDQLKVIDWMVSGGGAKTDENGKFLASESFDDSLLEEAFGGEQHARGFVSRNMKLFSKALHQLYSGFPGSSHAGTVAGRPSDEQMKGFQDRSPKLVKDAEGNWQRFAGKNSIQRRREEFAKDPEAVNDSWRQKGIKFDADRYDEMIEEVLGRDKATNIRKVTGIKHKEKMPVVPDFEYAIKLNIVSPEDVREAQNHIVASANHQISTAEHFGLLENYNHTHKLKDHTFHPKDKPEYEETPLDFVVHALGNGMGSLSREWHEIADAFAEFAPGVFFSNLAKEVPPKIFPARGLPDTRGNYKGNKPVMQSWQYTNDMSNAERIEHAKSLRRWLNEMGASKDEKDSAEARLADGKRVEYEAYPSRPDGKSQSQATREIMSLPKDENRPGEGSLDLDFSQEEFEMALKNNPQYYPASPGLNFLHCLLPYSIDMPMGGILSAEAKSGRTNNNYSYHPSSQHRAQRAAAMREADDGRTFRSGQQIYSELEQATKKRGFYDHSYNTNLTKDDALAMLARKHLLVANAHHHPTTHDEKHHEEWKERAANSKSILSSKDHKDVLGRPDADMASELVGTEPFEDYGSAIYDSEQYTKALGAHGDGKILRVQALHKKSFAGLGELKEFILANTTDAKGTPVGELDYGTQKRILESAEEGEFKGFYVNDEGQVKRLNSAPSEQQHYQWACKTIRERIRDAVRDGKEDIADLATQQLHQQMKHAHKVTGVNPTPSPHERMQYEIDHALQTHEATKLATKVFIPLIQATHPNALRTGTARENNEAHANMAVVYNMAERFMRNKTPEQREKFLRDGKVHYLKEDGDVGELNIADFCSEDLRNEIRDFTVPRMSFTEPAPGLRNAEQHFAPLATKGQEPTGNHVLEAFVNGDIGRQDPELEKEYRIVQAVFDRARNACKDKNSTEELMKRVYARYIPHNKDSQEPIENAKHNFIRNLGDHHHEGIHRVDGQTVIPLMSGGEGVTMHEAHGNRRRNEFISQRTEIKALDAVLQDIKSQTQGTPYASDLGDTFTLMAQKKAMQKLPRKLKEVFAELANPTKLKGERGAAPAELIQQKVGGRHPDHAPLPAISDCLAGKDQVGITVDPAFLFRDAYDDKLLLDNPKKNHFHQSAGRHVGHVSPDLLKDCFEGMNNYDGSIYQNHEQQPLQITSSQLPAGEGMNTDQRAAQVAMDAATNNSQQFFQLCADRVTDDTLLIKDDGRPVPIKSMHRIFDLDDLKHLRGFSGDWIASHIPSGEPVILQKKGKRVKAYNAEMKLVELADCCEEDIPKVNDKDFVVHAIVGDKMVYFVDLLEAGDEKTHNMPAKDRVRHLRAQFESTETVKMPEPYNTKRSDDAGLAEAVSLLRDEAPSDILLRDASATYMRGEIRHPKWILLSKEKKVDVIVLDRKGTNYRIGVGPIMHPENYGSRSVEFEGNHYMDIGSAKGPRGFDKGEYVSVFCTGVSSNQAEHPVFTIRSARIDRDAHPQAADSVESLSVMLGESKVPHRARLKKGRIHIEFPAVHDEVIYDVIKEDGGWMLKPQKSMWGTDDYLFKLSEDMRPFWQPIATVLLKRDAEKMIDRVNRDKDDEVKPEEPAGHRKERKKILPKEEEIIKRGLELLERLRKEKITHTGVEGLGVDFADADVESPRGPTTNINDDTMPDFDPAAREYKEKPAKTDKKSKRIRTTEGEEAITDHRGNITITDPRV